MDDFARKSEGKQAKKQILASSKEFYVDCQQKVWPRLSVGLSMSNDR